MSVTEEVRPVLPIFGPITLEDMRGNALLTKTVMPLVAEVCKHSKGRFTVDKVADGLVTGAFKLWGVMRPPASLEAVAVTRVDGPVFEIILLGPEYEEMFAFLPAMQGEARSVGCSRMRLSGPNFWRRHLPEGWRMSAVVYERDLDARTD